MLTDLLKGLISGGGVDQAKAQSYVISRVAAYVIFIILFLVSIFGKQ